MCIKNVIVPDVGGKMSDLYDHVTADEDIFKKILSKVPGFSGYIERNSRRQSDKLLRGVVADNYEAQWRRISSLQRDLIKQGQIEYVADVESAAIKIRQFIDRVRTASYGYAGLFDALTINQNELAQLYQYDLALLQGADQVKGAVDNLETSIGSDGLPAAIRNLVSVAEKCVEAFNQRTQVITGGAQTASQ